MKKAIILITAIILLSGAGYLLVTEGARAIGKEEKMECLKWQSEAKELEAYYITEWQKAQCDAYSISIEAPVQPGTDAENSL